MIAIATPALVSSFGDRRIEAEAERLAAAMASLRAEAVRQRATLALYLEPTDGQYGGELFLGPLEQTEAPFGFSDPDQEQAPRTPSALPDDQAPPTRSVFEARTPLTLTDQQPVNGLASEMMTADTDPVQAGFARGPERIRIAVCTPSGQILASRPLWLHDDRSMFRVEVGLGIGNAVLSPLRLIPESDMAPEEEPDADLPEPPAEPTPRTPQPGDASP